MVVELSDLKINVYYPLLNYLTEFLHTVIYRLNLCTLNTSTMISVITTVIINPITAADMAIMTIYIDREHF